MIFVKNGNYIIYSNGKIFNLIKGEYIKPSLDKDGYERICYKGRVTSVHKIIISAFKNKPQNLQDPTIDHIDGNILNNDISNLRWIERSENSSCRRNKGQGELNHEAILTNDNVIEICKLLQKGFQIKDIAKMYNVDKSTISSIKRKKNWTSISKDYEFEIRKIKTKDEAQKQREEIISFLKQGIEPKDIIKKGYSSSVVWRLKVKLYGKSGEIK